MRKSSNRFTPLMLCLWLMAVACRPGVDTLDRPVQARAKVTLGLIRHGVAPEEDGVVRLVGERYIMELTALHVVIADLELHACTPPRRKAALDWFIPNAHAHVPESATRLGTPTLDDMLGDTGRARIVGEIAPPFGEYCSVRVVVAPADEDVVNLSDLPPDALTGHSAIIRGRWRQKEATDQAWQRFSHRLSSVSARHVTLPEPIVLDPSHDSAFVLVDSTLDGALADMLGDWLVSRHSKVPDDEAIAQRILDLVGDTQRRYTSPRTPETN